MTTFVEEFCWTSSLITILICLLIHYLFQLINKRFWGRKNSLEKIEVCEKSTSTNESPVNDEISIHKNEEKTKRASIFIVGSGDFDDDEGIRGPRPNMVDQKCQVDLISHLLPPLKSVEPSEGTSKCRDLCELCRLVKISDQVPLMTDQELVLLMINQKLKSSLLEKLLADEKRAVTVRRLWLAAVTNTEDMLALPYLHYDYSFVSNSCCENVIGYVPMPVGYAGPLKVNGQQFYIPMATTEGCLIASTNRGCRAISDGEGACAFVYNDGMSRGPALRFNRAVEAIEFKRWIEKTANFRLIKQKFDSTSRFAKLKSIKCNPAGRLIYLRFVATTGDAMGMNMVSKATESVLQMLQHQYFINMEVVSLSGNFCVDKKPSGLNWIEGRGKSVVAEAIVSSDVVHSCLKSDVDRLVQLNSTKNLIGSAVAGALGGFNAHSANIVTAVFLATGQDPAQNISSSNCLTQIERTENGDLYISCTMPSLEVGTVGGGTILPAQRACLEMLGCAGGSREWPGRNATQLALIIGSAVLAGELSLLAALSSGDLVRSHIKYNRSTINLLGASASTTALKPVSLEKTEQTSSLRDVERSAKAYLTPASCNQAFS